MYACVLLVGLMPRRGHQIPLKMELQTIASHYVGDRNQIQVLYKNKCSQLLSQLSGPIGVSFLSGLYSSATVTVVHFSSKERSSSRMYCDSKLGMSSQWCLTLQLVSFFWCIFPTFPQEQYRHMDAIAERKLRDYLPDSPCARNWSREHWNDCSESRC